MLHSSEYIMDTDTRNKSKNAQSEGKLIHTGNTQSSHQVDCNVLPPMGYTGNLTDATDTV